MSKVALYLAFVLGMLIFSKEGICGPAILSYFQGQWTVEKVVLSENGSWKTEMGNPTLGNHLVVIEHKAQLVINGNEYSCDLGNPEFTHSKLNELDMFNPSAKGTINPKDLGLPPDEHVFVLDLKDTSLFGKVILIDRYQFSIILVDGIIYLLKRTPVYPTDFSTTNPHYDLAWALEREHRYQEAIQEFRTVTMDDPENAAAYYGWGTVLEEVNAGHEDTQGDLAVEKLQKAVELSPEDVNRPIDPHSLVPRYGTVKGASLRLIDEIRIIQKRQRSHDNEM